MDGTEDDVVFDYEFYELLDENKNDENDENSEVMNFNSIDGEEVGLGIILNFNWLLEGGYAGGILGLLTQ